MARNLYSGKDRSHRQLRIGETVRRTLAPIIAQGFGDDLNVQNVSITVGEVRMSPDLRRATVFVLPLGGNQAEEIVAALNKDRSEIRRRMNKQLTLKYSPALHFELDTTFDKLDEARRLFELEEVRRDLDRAKEQHGP
ncbi:MAG: 30S ribosome-binding factor RbfA [Albidovulum sp.]|nr:30S ribosome-binding factor RbfA [Albidovulum sp.]MDE0306194.1 30S ribosome-binding factor RbfA [Albidovulum sp.]MDE0530333.1 30S ribosome-binding factor RbfA [Albidovulum sp.]